MVVQTQSVRIYSKDNCQWCDKAKALLTKHGLRYIEMNFGEDFTITDLRSLIGPDRKLTVPQIMFDDELVGGFEDLQKRLEAE